MLCFSGKQRHPPNIFQNALKKLSGDDCRMADKQQRFGTADLWKVTGGSEIATVKVMLFYENLRFFFGNLRK